MYQKFKHIQALQVNTNFENNQSKAKDSPTVPGQGYEQGQMQGQEPFEQGQMQGSVQEPMNGQEPFGQGQMQGPFQGSVQEPINELMFNQLPIDPLLRERYEEKQRQMPRPSPRLQSSLHTYPPVQGTPHNRTFEQNI